MLPRKPRLSSWEDCSTRCVRSLVECRWRRDGSWLISSGRRSGRSRRTCSRAVVRRGGGRSLSAVLAGQRGAAPLGRAQRCGLARVEHHPGAPIPLRHPSSRPAGECAGSENRRLSAASTHARRPGLPSAAPPRRLARPTLDDANFTSREIERFAAGGRGGASGPAAPSSRARPWNGRPGSSRATGGPPSSTVRRGKTNPEGSRPGARGPCRGARAADGGAGAVPGRRREPPASSR